MTAGGIFPALVGTIWLVVVALLVYGLLTVPGWRDDYLKVVHRNRAGIRATEKILWQSLAAVAALTILVWHPQSAEKIREFWVPFVKHALIPSMPWWLLLGLIYLWIVGFSNAINVTDGLDGLAVGCTIPVALVFGIMAYAAGNTIYSEYLLIPYVSGAGELTVICGALIGGWLTDRLFGGRAPGADCVLRDRRPCRCRRALCGSVRNGRGRRRFLPACAYRAAPWRNAGNHKS